MFQRVKILFSFFSLCMLKKSHDVCLIFCKTWKSIILNKWILSWRRKYYRPNSNNSGLICLWIQRIFDGENYCGNCYIYRYLHYAFFRCLLKFRYIWQITQNIDSFFISKKSKESSQNIFCFTLKDHLANVFPHCGVWVKSAILQFIN